MAKERSEKSPEVETIAHGLARALLGNFDDHTAPIQKGGEQCGRHQQLELERQHGGKNTPKESDHDLYQPSVLLLLL